MKNTILICVTLLFVSACSNRVKEQCMITSNTLCDIEEDFFGVSIGDLRPYEYNKKKRLYYFSKFNYEKDSLVYNTYFVVEGRYRLLNIEERLTADAKKAIDYYLGLMKKYSLMGVSVHQSRAGAYLPESCNAMTQLTFYTNAIDLSEIPELRDTSDRYPYVTFTHNYSLNPDTTRFLRSLYPGNWIGSCKGYASY